MEQQTVGGVPDLDVLASRFAGAAVEGALGAVPLELVPGRFRLQVPLTPAVLDDEGRVIPAVLAVVADTSVGICVHSGVPNSAGGPTVELRVDHVGPVGPGAAHLLVAADAVHVDTSTGSARVVLTDDTGALVAHGVGTMAVEQAVDGVPTRLRLPTVLPDVVYDFAAVAGLATADPGGDPAELRAPLTPAMANMRAQLHGGVLMAIAHAAQDRFQAGRGGPVRRLTFGVDYLRPVPLDGGGLMCRSAFVRHGRRFRTVRTEVVRADGKVAAIATGTSVVLSR
ncbi:PaaI family thioesterase [Pseudonocardia sp. K10HN5]|uniref:PaaI family thioesterase n=1 Tax=Pseudonocardia acidicola TaxID=2724939 RepID=A0ABX1SCW3_9PSEU|nr:PaaI family thioesterase [Pseudonocardia acidicola]